MKYRTGIAEPWLRFGVVEDEWRDWRWQASNSIRDPGKLAEFLHLNGMQNRMVREAVRRGKKMRIPPYDVALMGENPTGVGPDGMSISDRSSSRRCPRRRTTCSGRARRIRWRKAPGHTARPTSVIPTGSLLWSARAENAISTARTARGARTSARKVRTECL